MRKVKIYFILLLLSGFSSVFAQATRSETPVNTSSGNSLHDPKLSPEELALILTAGENNPAKINESSMADPKTDPKDLPTEEDYGLSNAKQAEVNAADPKLESGQVAKVKQAEPDPPSKAGSGANQPAGENGGIVPDYRNMSTGGNDQARGDEPKNIPDYRAKQGSGDQPTGDPPHK